MHGHWSFCLLFFNLPNTFLCSCVRMKTWNMTLDDAKEQQELAPNPKVLEKLFHFSCLFTKKSSDTFIHFNLDAGKWNFIWQMNGNNVITFQEEYKTNSLKKTEEGGELERTTWHITTLFPDLRHQPTTSITHDPVTWPLWYHYLHSWIFQHSDLCHCYLTDSKLNLCMYVTRCGHFNNVLAVYFGEMSIGS